MMVHHLFEEMGTWEVTVPEGIDYYDRFDSGGQKLRDSVLSQETDSIRAFAKWQRATQDVLSRPRG